MISEEMIAAFLESPAKPKVTSFDWARFFFAGADVEDELGGDGRHESSVAQMQRAVMVRCVRRPSPGMPSCHRAQRKGAVASCAWRRGILAGVLAVVIGAAWERRTVILRDGFPFRRVYKTRPAC